MSMSSSSRPSLPQPAPKHNIRDQLINAGYRLSRQTAPSFFGGAANNPFFGQQNVPPHSPQSQHRHPPLNQHQSMPFRSNSPNFPTTNTVIARISELENKQQQVNIGIIIYFSIISTINPIFSIRCQMVANSFNNNHSINSQI